ncbi:MAG: glycosyltransferase family 2 protein, partial [Bacteroidetes bacterium]
MNLSIIIPLYNEENLIKDVLKELNSLSYPDFVKKAEIIIVDD